jgi:hypothetical protein
MSRPSQHIDGSPFFNHPPCVHHRHAICHSRHHSEIVRDEK